MDAAASAALSSRRSATMVQLSPGRSNQSHPPSVSYRFGTCQPQQLNSKIRKHLILMMGSEACSEAGQRGVDVIRRNDAAVED